MKYGRTYNNERKNNKCLIFKLMTKQSLHFRTDCYEKKGRKKQRHIFTFLQFPGLNCLYYYTNCQANQGTREVDGHTYVHTRESSAVPVFGLPCLARQGTSRGLSSIEAVECNHRTSVGRPRPCLQWVGECNFDFFKYFFGNSLYCIFKLQQYHSSGSPRLVERTPALFIILVKQCRAEGRSGEGQLKNKAKKYEGETKQNSNRAVGRHH